MLHPPYWLHSELVFPEHLNAFVLLGGWGIATMVMPCHKG